MSASPYVEAIWRPPDASLAVTRRVEAEFKIAWHKHPCYELTLIEESIGTRLVGDDVATYASGDLVLLGPMLAHTWVSSVAHQSQSAVAIHFDRSVVSAWPESREYASLLDRACQGLAFSGPGTGRAANIVRGLPARDPILRITSLIEVLFALASGPAIEIEELNTPGLPIANEPLDPRTAQALRHVAEHFRHSISQAEVADMVGLDPASFSRQFKRAVGRTFTRYVQEVRVAEASRRLTESPTPVTLIAFESGFGNLASFNRVFLGVRGCTPSEYRTIRNKVPSRA